MLCGLEYSAVALSVSVCIGFFFQAEDGIRDLVRSRGLGDVYKRQPLMPVTRAEWGAIMRAMSGAAAGREWALRVTITSVSYTHLTLPTSDLV